MLARSPGAHATHFIRAQLYWSGDEQDDLEPLVRFVNPFEGLEGLYISFPAFASPTDEYWESVLHHKSTLKRVEHQQVGASLDPRHG
jgi:hypothetical protein